MKASANYDKLGQVIEIEIKESELPKLTYISTTHPI
jgi:hypothetical protein